MNKDKDLDEFNDWLINREDSIEFKDKKYNGDIFDLPIDEFTKEVKKLVDGYNPEDLLKELVKCGLVLKGDTNEDIKTRS